MKYYDYDYSQSSSYSSDSSSSYHSSGSDGSRSYTPKAILPENTIVVVHQEAVQILQAAATVQRNIIMIHTMMVMMMSIWMETMIMTDTTAMMIMLPV